MSYSDNKRISLTRQANLVNALQPSGLDALVLNPGASLTYLTNLHFHLMERPVIVLFVPDSPPFVVLPELEAAKIKELPFPVQAFQYTDDPETWSLAFQKAVEAARLDKTCRIGVEPQRLRVLELRFLENAIPEAIFVSAEKSLAQLRMRKDESEIKAMRMAVDVAQRAFQATLPFIKPGITERELASELTLQLLRSGSDPALPFYPIVASGPNSANPHSTPTGRKLEYGDLLVLDWGATIKGYVSDLTRTLALGEVEPELAHIAQIVQKANAAGRAAAQPGIPAREVDNASRKLIENAGYGPYFIHRTGHGLGMEAHEEPYIHSGNDLPLDPGMTFTVEPGIYLPGRGGVRVEDDMWVTVDGAESLSNLPRNLLVLE